MPVGPVRTIPKLGELVARTVVAVSGVPDPPAGAEVGRPPDAEQAATIAVTRTRLPRTRVGVIRFSAR
jgi:hypothetical protein